MAIKQAKVRKRAEGPGEGAEEIEDVTHRKKGDGASRKGKGSRAGLQAGANGDMRQLT